jgi:hypothetical protein
MAEAMSISPEGPDQKTEVRGGGGGDPGGGGGRGGDPGGGGGPGRGGRPQANPGRARPTPTAHVSRVAAAQWGVIGLRQLRECGVAKSTVADWANAGRLHRRYPGVYTVGHPSLPVEGELTAALLAAGPDAVLSHATAA